MHEYLRRFNLALEKGLTFTPTLHEMQVRHDNWCPINLGNTCDCDPEITIIGPEGNIQIDKDGDMKFVGEH